MRTENGKLATGASASASRHFAVFSFQFSVFNLIGFLAFSPLNAAPHPSLHIEERALTVIAWSDAIKNVTVSTKGSEQPLFGAFRDGVFVPAAPFVRGRSYEVALELADGSKSRMTVTFGASPQSAPIVRVSPATSLIPANTLKLYLDFSESMEQGVFLKHLTLQRRNGEEVAGAFRETELWSPDGKRLTVMLHPGRQKTGVNLNVDEGPVLTAGEHYNLAVSGHWRSVAGIALGKEAVFSLDPIAADHEQPDPARWQIHVPKAGTTGPVVIITNELFEPQIFLRALDVTGVPGKAEAKVIDLKRVEWRFIPLQPWQPGGYQITVAPELEDLAGNTTQKLFEVDLSAKPPLANPSTLTFQISAP